MNGTSPLTRERMHRQALQAVERQARAARRASTSGRRASNFKQDLAKANEKRLLERISQLTEKIEYKAEEEDEEEEESEEEDVVEAAAAAVEQRSSPSRASRRPSQSIRREVKRKLTGSGPVVLARFASRAAASAGKKLNKNRWKRAVEAAEDTSPMRRLQEIIRQAHGKTGRGTQTEILRAAVDTIVTEKGSSSHDHSWSLDKRPDRLPAFMVEPAIDVGGRLLDKTTFVRWHERCEEWLEDYESRQVLFDTHCIRQEDTAIILPDCLDDSRGQVLHALAEGCPKLTSLTLRDGYITDDALYAFALSVRERLTTLDLHGTRGFSDDGLKHIAAFCEQLTILRVGLCAVSDESLKSIAKYCRHLQLLEVSEPYPFSGVTEKGLSTLMLPPRCVVERVSGRYGDT